ncbi:MAG: glutathione-dependent formaldehyde dehydrogenase, partial [Chloroflexota bacterium]
NFEEEEPVATLMRLTGGIGPDRIIDAVGVDAVKPERGPAAKTVKPMENQFEKEVKQVAPETNPKGPNWRPGDAPSMALQWAVEAVAKAGTIAIIGVYPETARSFPIGMAMMKNLTIKMGNCPHRKYLPMLVDLVASGAVDPSNILTKVEPITNVMDAYKAFDARQPGWLKVELLPDGIAMPAR